MKNLPFITSQPSDAAVAVYDLRLADIDFRGSNKRQPLDSEAFERVKQNFSLLVDATEQIGTARYEGLKVAVGLIAYSAEIQGYRQETPDARVELHTDVLEGRPPLKRLVSVGQLYSDLR